MAGAQPVTGGPAGVRRVAVLGDIGGHVAELRRELARLGADADGTLPPDLMVVQVGDLVHRGPHSAEVVELVGHYLTRQPDQWRQLVGNHEALYLEEPRFAWPQRLTGRDARTLARWWADGTMVAAWACTVAGEQFLVTHAGLTHGYWRELGSPGTAAETADAVNHVARTDPDRLFRPGMMLSGPVASRGPAGPVWAAAGHELVASWAHDRLPFSQIHGHSSVLDWASGTVRMPPDLRSRLRVDDVARHASVHLDGGRIIGVDPGHDRTPQPWRALELGLPRAGPG